MMNTPHGLQPVPQPRVLLAHALRRARSQERSSSSSSSSSAAYASSSSSTADSGKAEPTSSQAPPSKEEDDPMCAEKERLARLSSWWTEDNPVEDQASEAPVIVVIPPQEDNRNTRPSLRLLDAKSDFCFACGKAKATLAGACTHCGQEGKDPLLWQLKTPMLYCKACEGPMEFTDAFCERCGESA